jgi:hypothetical protein
MEPYSVPSLEELKHIVTPVPMYMRPTLLPYFVVCEGALSNEICDSIIYTLMKEDGYRFEGCEAETRECSRPLHPVLNPIFQFTWSMNSIWWNFVLDNEPGAWLQTYEVGDSYDTHTDGSLGQTRKLTTIALLSDPADYDGGQLRMIPYPEQHHIPKTRGTLCVFPPWMLHDVSPVERGLRQTINMGFWGPPFR